MEELKDLEAMGLALPTPAYLFGIILFGILGYAAYRHGKQAALPMVRWLGAALMLYPYFVSTTWLMYVVGLGLCLGIYHFRR